MKRLNEVPTTVKSPANLLSIIVVVKFRSWMTVPENCHEKSGWILNLLWLMCYNQHCEIYSTGPNWRAVLKDAVSLNFYKSFIQIRLYLHGVLGSRWILSPSGSFVFSMVLLENYWPTDFSPKSAFILIVLVQMYIFSIQRSLQNWKRKRFDCCCCYLVTQSHSMCIRDPPFKVKITSRLWSTILMYL